MSSDVTFAALSKQAQVAKVRQALQSRLGAGLPLKLVTHQYNTTFRLDGDVPIALRVNINSRRTPSEVGGELELVRHLNGYPGIYVPRPVDLFDGSAMTLLAIDGLDALRPVAAYTWLPGRESRWSIPTWGRVGAVMRNLHAATRGFALSGGHERPPFDDVLDGLPWNLPHSELNEALNRANAAMASLEGSPRQIVHCDLHAGNTKTHNGKLSVFDFDDALWSWPAVDVAQTLYYVRRSPHAQASEKAFWHHLGESPSSLGISPEGLEALIAGRALLLVADLAQNINAELQEQFSDYLKVTRARISAYLETGRFDPKVQ